MHDPKENIGTGIINPSIPDVGEAEGNRLFETNKTLVERVRRLEAQLKTARDQRDELAELITPAVDWKLVADCDQHTVARMVTAGWSPKFVSSAPRPGIMRADNNDVSPVVVTVMFERIVPDRPTPPERMDIVTHKADSKTQSEEEEADDDVQAAARLSFLPTHDKAELNRIAVMNAVRRTQELFRGYDKSPRPVNVIEGHLA
ncbi:MAG: hypothetical protein RLP44_02345 [Aggregatilineales bacterium]